MRFHFSPPFFLQLNGKPKIAQMSRTGSGRKQVISWMDAPDDYYFRPTENNKWVWHSARWFFIAHCQCGLLQTITTRPNGTGAEAISAKAVAKDIANQQQSLESFFNRRRRPGGHSRLTHATAATATTKAFACIICSSTTSTASARSPSVAAPSRLQHGGTAQLRERERGCTDICARERGHDGRRRRVYKQVVARERDGWRMWAGGQVHFAKNEKWEDKKLINWLNRFIS
jgi:hypothetical protein